jgi:YgiT-type zinc finger domain-containing protein
VKARCAVCGGDLRPTTLTHEERRGTALYLFENVPAQACSAWGEIWIEEATLQAMDGLIREGRPTRKVQTPLYDLAGAGVK